VEAARVTAAIRDGQKGGPGLWMIKESGFSLVELFILEIFLNYLKICTYFWYNEGWLIKRTLVREPTRRLPFIPPFKSFSGCSNPNENRTAAGGPGPTRAG
jgi:hypothetical protein